MAIALETAKAAMETLRSFSALRQNLTGHQPYHFYEVKARARITARQATRCGFYTKKKVVTYYKHKTTLEEKRTKGKWKRSQYDIIKKVQENSFAEGSKIENSETVDTIVNGVLLPAMLDRANGTYKADATRPDDVFIYAYPLPSSIGGTTVTANGDYDCDHVAMVVERSGEQWRLVTHYPCDSGSYSNLTDLA